MKKYEVTLTFTQPILGTVTKDKEIYTSFVQAKQLAEAKKTGVEISPEMLDEEAEAAINGSNLEEKGWTGFHETADGQPFLFDYVLKGFFKDCCGMLRRVRGTESSKIKAFKKIIDGLIFIEPRQIPLVMNGGERSVLERPLRAQTAQGERVALAKSDTCPPGTKLRFTVLVMGDDVDEKLLREWFDYGRYRGLGQWRNAGYGAFEYEMSEAPA